MKSLKLNDHMVDNDTNFCDAISVDAESLESAGDFNPKHRGYIIRIFKDTSDSRFYLWATQNYKDFLEFIKKLCVCDEDVMKPDGIIYYGPPVQ